MSHRPGRAAWGVSLLVVLPAVVAPTARRPAARDVAEDVAQDVAAQPVLLRVRPRLGDTLRTRLDQHVELVATRHVGVGDSVLSVTTDTRIMSRAIVEASGPDGTLLSAITDSAAVASNAADRPALERARQAMVGQRSRLRVTPAGATEVLDAPAGSEAAFAQLPGMLPDGPVNVGDSWTRVMAMPGVADPSAAAGQMRVAFRLDSLGRRNELAFVSMRGAMTRNGDAAANGLRYDATGVVTGSIVVDRRRGWLTDSRTVFTSSSVLTPPDAIARGGEGVVHIKLRVTQRMRVF